MLHHKKQLKHGIQTQNYLIPTKQPGLFSASSDPFRFISPLLADKSFRYYGAKEIEFSTVRPVVRRDRLEAYPTLRQGDFAVGRGHVPLNAFFLGISQSIDHCSVCGRPQHQHPNTPILQYSNTPGRLRALVRRLQSNRFRTIL